MQRIGEKNPSAALSDADFRRLAQAADRLTSILRIILAALPQRGVPLRAAASDLGIDFSTLQRVASSAHKPAALESLLALPGPRALRIFVEAAERAEVDSGSLRQARRAIDEYASLVTELGGSHARLRRRLLHTANPAPARQPARVPEIAAADPKAVDLAARRQMFDLVSEVTRARMKGRVSITAIGPVAGRPDQIELGILSAHLGYVARPGAMPLIAGVFRNVQDDPDGLRSQLGRLSADRRTILSGTSIVEHLGTTPPARLTTQGRHGRVVHIVDVPADAAPIDIVTASRAKPSAHPRLRGDGQECSYMKVRHACEHMVLDVFLHRSLASISIPSGGVLLTDPALLEFRGIAAVNAWDDRVPTTPTLQLLGYGLDQAHSAVWHRHREAAEELFARLGWDPNQFIGFRLEAAHPMWGTYYYLNFDFSENAEPPTAYAVPPELA